MHVVPPPSHCGLAYMARRIRIKTVAGPGDTLQCLDRHHAYRTVVVVQRFHQAFEDLGRDVRITGVAISHSENRIQPAERGRRGPATDGRTGAPQSTRKSEQEQGKNYTP